MIFVSCTAIAGIDSRDPSRHRQAHGGSFFRGFGPEPCAGHEAAHLIPTSIVVMVLPPGNRKWAPLSTTLGM